MCPPRFGRVSSSVRSTGKVLNFTVTDPQSIPIREFMATGRHIPSTTTHEIASLGAHRADKPRDSIQLGPYSCKHSPWDCQLLQSQIPPRERVGNRLQ